MEIIKKQNGNTLHIALQGRLDTTTAPKLEAEMKASLPGVTELVLDLADLQYISSAGLRVLLMCQKTMRKQGEMYIEHVNDTNMEIFEVTGFCDILNIR